MLIVSAWRARYDGDQRTRQLPSLGPILLAALCPRHVDVAVAHEHVRPVNPDEVDADLVAITAMTGSAPRMYELADQLRARGICVLLGGPHVSLTPDEALLHADAIAIGEAETTFPRMIADFERHGLERVYQQPAGLPLTNLPVPRFDLLEKEFKFRCYVQATRGCPYRCNFCTLKALDDCYRVRPPDDVIRDILAGDGHNWLQRKFVWFWDDNITGSHEYARVLFERLKPLRKWWWSQCTINLAEDRNLVRLAAQSGCVGLFVGLETFSAENLLQVRKRQNHVERYRDAIRTFHDFGIAVHAGIIVGLDHDTLDSMHLIPDIVAELGVDLPFVNVLTPFPGTEMSGDLERAGRLHHREWQFHDAAHVVFDPAQMSAEELETGFWETRGALYSVERTIPRMLRGVGALRASAWWLSGTINGVMMAQNRIHPDRPWPSENVNALARRGPTTPPPHTRSTTPTGS